MKIHELRKMAESRCCPIISLDTKQKELLGEYSRNNDALYGIEAQATLDHDFKSKETQTLIPHGIYDIGQNKGYLTLNTSSDTSEFVCDNIEKWWTTIGVFSYDSAPYLLILCDGGGSNSSRHYIFKEDLEKLAQKIGIDIRIAHYPPYCSKWNPIEHRLFSHVTKAMKGANMVDIDDAKNRILRTKTTTGLTVVVDINEKVYLKGRKYQANYKDNMGILFDDFLPKWNYLAKALP